MRKQSKAEKAIDKRIEKAYYASCSGLAINIMDISKVFAVGKRLIEHGGKDFGDLSDVELQTGLRAYVETIAK